MLTEAATKYVTVTVNVETHKILSVDGVFSSVAEAQAHVDKMNEFHGRDVKYKTTVEPVTKPR